MTIWQPSINYYMINAEKQPSLCEMMRMMICFIEASFIIGTQLQIYILHYLTLQYKYINMKINPCKYTQRGLFHYLFSRFINKDMFQAFKLVLWCCFDVWRGSLVDLSYGNRAFALGHKCTYDMD